MFVEYLQLDFFYTVTKCPRVSFSNGSGKMDKIGKITDVLYLHHFCDFLGLPTFIVFLLLIIITVFHCFF